jgi:DNA-binding CsgD family transcriptional regulator
LIARLLRDDAVAGASGSWFGETPQAEFRVVEEVVALVEDLSARGPVLLVVEDLQWADPSTLLVLHLLGRRIRQLPLLLVATARPVPRSAELERCLSGLRAGGATDLVLGPLDDVEVASLVEQLVRAPPSPALLRQVAGTGGNPLFVTELVGALQRDGSIQLRSDGRAEVTTVGILPALPLLILHRLSFLAPATLEVLRVASVLGSSFAVPDLSLAAGRPTAGLLAALEEAMAAGILEPRDEQLGFRHDLIREALYQDLPAGVRQGLHLDAGRALAAAGAPPERVAEQWARGAAPGDRQAVDWLQRAARVAAPRAPSVAVDLLQRALELADPADPVRDGLLAEQAISLMWSGRLADAQAVCRDVLGRAHDPNTDATLRLCVVQTLLGRARLEEALKETDAAVATQQLSEPDRVRFQAFKASALASFGQLEAAAEIAAQVRPVAEALGDELSGCICLAILALVTNLGGDFVGALETANDAVRLADQSAGLAAHRFPVNLFLGGCLHDTDQLEAGQAALQRGRRLSEELGAKRDLPFYYWALAQGCLWAGDWDDALAECQTCVELADEYGMRLHGTVFSHSIRAVIAVHRDDLPEAAQAIVAAEQELASTGPQLGSDWLQWAKALLMEAHGQAAGSLATLGRAWDECADQGLVSTLPLLGADLVRLAGAAGDRQRAERATTAIEDLAARNPGVATLNGAALRCRGLLEDNPEILLQAVAAYKAGPRPLERAQACEDAAWALGRAGKVGEARPYVDDAFDLYQRLEAPWDLARASGRLRALGIRPGRRGSRRRPRSGWESLTATERKVVRLVAEGLSNPEIAERMFISRGTVHTHVSHILAKLGLRSRVSLAAEASRRGPLKLPAARPATGCWSSTQMVITMTAGYAGGPRKHLPVGRCFGRPAQPRSPVMAANRWRGAVMGERLRKPETLVVVAVVCLVSAVGNGLHDDDFSNAATILFSVLGSLFLTAAIVQVAVSHGRRPTGTGRDPTLDRAERARRLQQELRALERPNIDGPMGGGAGWGAG